jgi:inosine triphosphate pyrophosphatase
VFVTGNANKLKEVKAILAVGGSGIEVTSQAVDGQSTHTYSARTD